MENKRKIIQITSLPESEQFFGTIYALCDDGTVWARTISGGKKEWKQIDLPPGCN